MFSIPDPFTPAPAIHSEQALTQHFLRLLSQESAAGNAATDHPVPHTINPEALVFGRLVAG
jgi:hypothetical protein